jgi:hypothetical protein
MQLDEQSIRFQESGAGRRDLRYHSKLSTEALLSLQTALPSGEILLTILKKTTELPAYPNLPTQVFVLNIIMVNFAAKQ